MMACQKHRVIDGPRHRALEIDILLSPAMDLSNEDCYTPYQLLNAMDWTTFMQTVDFVLSTFDFLPTYANGQLPNFPLSAYLLDIQRRGRISRECYMCAARLVQRIRYDVLADDELNATDLFLLFTTCVIISSKALEDLTYQNKDWSTLTRIPLPKLNQLEQRIIRLLQWKVNVSLDELDETFASVRPATPEPMAKTAAGIEEPVAMSFLHSSTPVVQCL
ncbi:Cyclin PHO80-like [Carpediemonas membranifera]|uniref:Cyclin PHO80-like n=1 Tax=Carpediemonas membranifera TaxID=201153 RepID=A0A8J6E3T3_9EUKA|nr:Cyclin PHO80-like [Carpediemonas membranifera]|eukprot:KAG9395981.1 Cyclin PHO80-like [Carpediemonas membranifera]